MTYNRFLRVSEDNKFIMYLSLDREYISFNINNEKDFNNVQKSRYSKVNFNRFKGEKLIEVYKTTKK